MNDEANSHLNQEFAQAADNPKSFDFGFEEQRKDCGFANFDFPPDEAAAMRERELARIAKEWENEPVSYDEPEVDEDGWTGQEDNEDDGRDPFDDNDWDDYEDDYDSDLDEDEDEYDRFADSVGGGDDWVDDEDWENDEFDGYDQG